MSGPTRLIRGTHHAHAATPDQRLHRRPPAPARHCGICGARLRASNPDRLCAPCDTREQAALADIPEALRRGDVQDALAFIAHMDVNTAPSGDESCAICHRPGEVNAVDLMHKIR